MAHVLVVENDESERSRLATLLEGAGYRVTVANNGLEGLLRYEKDHQDLVLTDIFMPIMDGIEMITDLSRNHPQAKIITMSGGNQLFDNRFLQKMTRLFGVTESINKPVDPRDLLASVAHALH